MPAAHPLRQRNSVQLLGTPNVLASYRAAVDAVPLLPRSCVWASARLWSGSSSLEPLVGASDPGIPELVGTTFLGANEVEQCHGPNFRFSAPRLGDRTLSVQEVPEHPARQRRASLTRSTRPRHPSVKASAASRRLPAVPSRERPPAQSLRRCQSRSRQWLQSRPRPPSRPLRPSPARTLARHAPPRPAAPRQPWWRRSMYAARRRSSA